MTNQKTTRVTLSKQMKVLKEVTEETGRKLLVVDQKTLVRGTKDLTASQRAVEKHPHCCSTMQGCSVIKGVKGWLSADSLVAAIALAK